MVHCPDRRYPIVLSVLLIGNRSQHAMHGMACWRFSLVLANNARLAQQCQLRREPSCCNLVLLCGRHGSMLNRLLCVEREHQLCFTQLSYAVHCQTMCLHAYGASLHHNVLKPCSAPDKVPAISSGQGGSAGQSPSPATLLHSQPQCQRQNPCSSDPKHCMGMARAMQVEYDSVSNTVTEQNRAETPGCTVQGQRLNITEQHAAGGWEAALMALCNEQPAQCSEQPAQCS